MTRPLRVFLCHASQDKPAVWKLRRFLKQRGAQPWLDQADLFPGQHWEVEIPKAINTSDVILVCLSKNSVNKEGYVQKEIVFALDKALEKPEGMIFIVPVKLEECDVPKRLSPYQWVDYYRPEGRKRLLLGLNKRVIELGDDVLPMILEETRQKKAVLNDKNSDQIGRDAIQETEHVKLASEIKEEERESSRRDAFAKVVRDAKEFAEAAEQEGSEKWKPEAQKQESPVSKLVPKKPFTQILDPSTLAPKARRDSQELRKPASYNNVRWLGIGGTIFIGALLLVWMFGNKYIVNNPRVTETPVITFSATLKSVTPTQTNPSLSSTSTQIPYTLTPTSVPNLQIGSTMVAEKDRMVLVYVPEGKFIMGSDSYANEKPIHWVFLDAYWIDQTEVTNAMYARCVDAGQCNPGSENDDDLKNRPVTFVSWYDANDYCKFAGRRLPTEAEWEKAARGENGYTYPWGSIDPQDYLLNFDGNVGSSTDVGSYPEGASVYGALDMAGNVSEWVSSIYLPYPYDASDGREDLISFDDRAVRGSSSHSFNRDIHSAFREKSDPKLSNFILGFRCTKSP